MDDSGEIGKISCLEEGNLTPQVRNAGAVSIDPPVARVNLINEKSFANAWPNPDDAALNLARLGLPAPTIQCSADLVQLVVAILQANVRLARGVAAAARRAFGDPSPSLLTRV